MAIRAWLIIIDLVTSAELCPTAENPDKVIKDMKKWLKEQDLIDLEPVSLFAEQLEKVSNLDLGNMLTLVGNGQIDRTNGGSLPINQDARIDQKGCHQEYPQTSRPQARSRGVPTARTIVLAR